MFNGGYGSGPTLYAEFVAPAGICNDQTGFHPSVGQALAPGQTSAIFEFSLDFFFAGYSHSYVAYLTGSITRSQARLITR